MVSRICPYKAHHIDLNFEALTWINVISLVNYSLQELFNHPGLFNLSEGLPNRQQGHVIDVCALQGKACAVCIEVEIYSILYPVYSHTLHSHKLVLVCLLVGSSQANVPKVLPLLILLALSVASMC